MLVEISFQVGIILGDEKLVVDVAEIVELLVAAQTVVAIRVVDLLADSASPGPALFLLVADAAV
jgi:hypothetical protein